MFNSCADVLSCWLLECATNWLIFIVVSVPEQSQSQICDGLSAILVKKYRGLGCCCEWPLIVKYSLCGRTLTVLRIEEERPSLTVGHAPVLLATTGPKDTDLPGLYWLGSQLAVAALAPCQLSHSGLGFGPLLKLWRLLNKRASCV